MYLKDLKYNIQLCLICIEMLKINNLHADTNILLTVLNSSSIFCVLA